jgi:hypothetical protein
VNNQEGDIEKLIRERDSLRLALEASRTAHRFDNDYLLRERDEARRIARDLFLQVGDRIMGGPYPEWVWKDD